MGLLKNPFIWFGVVLVVGGASVLILYWDHLYERPPALVWFAIFAVTAIAAWRTLYVIGRAQKRADIEQKKWPWA